MGSAEDGVAPLYANSTPVNIDDSTAADPVDIETLVLSGMLRSTYLAARRAGDPVSTAYRSAARRVTREDAPPLNRTLRSLLRELESGLVGCG